MNHLILIIINGIVIIAGVIFFVYLAFKVMRRNEPRFETSMIRKCEICGKESENSDLIELDGEKVCSDCKDISVQKIKEGTKNKRTQSPDQTNTTMWLTVAAIGTILTVVSLCIFLYI